MPAIKVAKKLVVRELDPDRDRKSARGRDAAIRCRPHNSASRSSPETIARHPKFAEKEVALTDLLYSTIEF